MDLYWYWLTDQVAGQAKAMGKERCYPFLNVLNWSFSLKKNVNFGSISCSSLSQSSTRQISKPVIFLFELMPEIPQITFSWVVSQTITRDTRNSGKKRRWHVERKKTDEGRGRRKNKNKRQKTRENQAYVGEPFLGCFQEIPVLQRFIWNPGGC